MKEEELKYLLCLLDDLTEDLFEEFLQLNNDIEESKGHNELSEQACTFLKQNLYSNPVTTSVVLTYLQSKSDTTNNQNCKILQNLYLDVLEDVLLNANNVDKVITLVSLFKLKDEHILDFTNRIINHFSEDTFRHHRKQILMSLVPLKKPEILKTISALMYKTESQQEFKLTPEYMLDLCYQEKVHWLLKAAQIYKHQLQDIRNIKFRINNFTKQILIMVLIDLTNSPETYDLVSLVNQLTNIFSILDTYTTADEQLQFYILEVKRELTIIKFCLENNCKMMTTSLFNQLLTQSAFAVVSQLCRLSKVDRYKVSRLLNSNNDSLNELMHLTESDIKLRQPNINWDILTYNSYCAITKIIDTVMVASESSDEDQDMTSSLDEVKRLIASIQPIQYSIEVIENIFSCLFLRYEYFSCAEHTQDSPCGAHSDCSYFYWKKQSRSPQNSKMSSGFMCNANITQLIINTIKLCLDLIEEKINMETVDTSVTKRYKHLVKIVNHSIWKLQLVSNLSPDTSPLQLRLCLDYVEVDRSSEDEEQDSDSQKVLRKKPRVRRRNTNTRPDQTEQVMISSSMSANDDGYATNNTSNIDFTSIMLSKPNCLVALALYHNDFPKANQIIEMFDLADAEIATEVTFTEQLRSLVAKIKNIIFYKDDTRYSTKELSTLSVVSTEVMSLVEGFLASNRAPNSFDIIELSARHPHLQLYSHQNAPLINAVDILLSSGLNREITYGLINVVERKLAEVRSSTDVAAVRKTNYIRFVEDIASVVFEIFGNTEKSFNFADNICGLITDSRVPIKHKEFCKMNQLSKELMKSCDDLAEIVNTDTDRQADPGLLQKYHQTYMNVVAASDKDMCNISEVCLLGSKKTRIHYLRMCYMYCKTVSQLEQSDTKSHDSNSESSYFSVLERRLHDIFGNMINDKDVPVASLEPICRKLNVNLIPQLILNCCPPITLSNAHKEATEANFNNLLQVVYDFKNSEENLFIEPTTNFGPLPCTPDPQCLTYIVLHNWVLAHIIKKIHTSPNETSFQQSMDARTKFINNYMELERFNYMKVLFDNNKYLASLHTTIDLDKLFTFMPKLFECGKVLKCLNILDALPEHQLMCSANLANLRDLVLFKLAINPRIEHNWKYCQHLKCPELKVNLVLNNLNNWPSEGAMEVLDYLRFLLDQVAHDEKLFDKCNEWMTKIPLYEQIAPIMGVSHWYNIYEKSLEAPEEIIDLLLDSKQFKLCLEWADVHDASENMKQLIVVNLIRQLFEYTTQATPQLTRDLLLRLPTAQAVDLIQEEMCKVRSVEILQVCIDFISEHSTDWKSFENIKIGLQIMLEIDINLRHLFWDIIEKPLLMIEQFLMNAKLDILANIMNKLAPHLKCDPSGDNLYYNMKSIENVIISRNAVDGLLRFYAEKALDMKNPRRAYTPPQRQSDESLMQSIDSINMETSSKPFVMPEQVPSKEQWAQDYSTDKCMMCHESIFSMIIRRHHCRRCGRVVCHACSRHRMQVPTYPSGVKFRVCDDCFTQTMSARATSGDNLMQASTSGSADSGATCMDWRLSACADRNAAVRAEFSYEFTPNVTLCLSIVRMHSVNLDYPRFLLDRSDEVSRELSSGGDARMLLRARRWLLLAAAELYSRAPQHNSNSSATRVAEAGALHAARCLAHADAMSTLVNHAAHHLTPPQGAHPSHIVRSLLEAEKWELALEIATKSGLSRVSVLAAWGKACVRAGCFGQARERFARCFKHAPLADCERASEAAEAVPAVHRRLQSLRHSERSSSISSVQSDGRPRSNPPLLNEIISMLEELNYPVNQALVNKAETIKVTNERLISLNTGKKKIKVTEPALNIMHTLASVKKIKQGDYSDFQTAIKQPKKSLAQGLLRRSNNHEPKIDQNKLDPFFYKECEYYLSNYGSHTANISFYLKHSNVAEVLKYCNDNMVDRDTFTEAVYTECLKIDKVNELLKHMSDMDSTLEMWGDYITHIGRTLEASHRLDALYAFQCGSGQQARAAATCARLYARPVPRTAVFTTLATRNQQLAIAHHHLASCMPISSKSNDQKSFHLHLDKATIDKHMTTISRQMELTKFLAACEASHRLNDKVINDVIPMANEDTKSKDVRPLTLFGSNTDRIRLVAVTLVSGQTVEEGFGLALKIITENKLDSMNIYMHVARHLVKTDRFMEVKALAKCIRVSKETAASLMSDQVLEAGVTAVVAQCEQRGQLHDEQAELLIEDVHSVGIKITCYLTCRIVSTAYILAARHDRTNDLRRVLHEAERLGNDHVRSACLKRLARKNLP